MSPNGVYNDTGSSDYRQTFFYVGEQLNDCGLAYIHLMDGLAFSFQELGTPITLTEFRDMFSVLSIDNCGYTQPQAESAISSGVTDLIAFGRPSIGNPDLVERFARNLPLNAPAEINTWYCFGAEGNRDFPTYQESLTD